MKDKYYEQAVTCVKDRVLPVQMELYRSCSGDLDRVYGGALSHMPLKMHLSKVRHLWYALS